MKIYVSGPMTGIPHHNYPAFDAARDKLLADGHEVVSPPDINRRVGIGADHTISETKYQQLLRDDLYGLLACDAIYLLPGWQNSRGATLERQVAMTIGMEVIVEGVEDVAEAPKDGGTA